MVDRTGPVLVSLWDSAAHQFQRVLQHAAKGSRPILLLQKVRITPMPQNDWNGNFVTPIKVLGSVASGEGGDGTNVQRLSAPLFPYNQKDTLFACPVPPAAVNDFRQLRDYTLPFRGTFVGCVQNLAELDVAASGQHKRDFDLVDEAGGTFACSIIGLHAKATKIQNNNKVILYYAGGRRVGQTDAFVVYIFRDGFVAVIGTVDPPPNILDRATTRTTDS